MKSQIQSYRQGDVLVIPVESIPPAGKLKPVARENGRIILAHGEVTGHAHAITNRVAKFFETSAGERFLDLDTGVDLKHEEHGTIRLPAGKYQVRRQREYSPEAIRNVAD